MVDLVFFLLDLLCGHSLILETHFPSPTSKLCLSRFSLLSISGHVSGSLVGSFSSFGHQKCYWSLGHVISGSRHSPQVRGLSPNSTATYMLMTSNLDVWSPGKAPAHRHQILAPCGCVSRGIHWMGLWEKAPKCFLYLEVMQSSTWGYSFPLPHCSSQKQI